MGIKGRKALIAGFIAAALVCWLLAGLVFEPSYHGKSLSAWLEAYDGGSEGYKASPEADAALRAIGPAAVPHLLQRLKATNTFGWPHLVKNSTGQKGNPHAVHSGKPQMRFGVPAFAQTPLARFVETNTPFHFERQWVPPNQQRWKVYAAFRALGSLGESAVPDLAKLARNTNNDQPLNLKTNGIAATFLLIPAQRFMLQQGPSTFTQIGPLAIVGSGGNVAGLPAPGNMSPSPLENYLDGDMAAWCLAAIGDKAVPPVLELLADQNPLLHKRGIIAVGMIGPGAEPAVPALIDALSDIDPRMKVCAVNSLAQIGEAATNAAPALLTNFSSFGGLIRQSTAVAISRISPEVTERAIVPALLQDLQDSKPISRNIALDTLAQLHYPPPNIIPAIITALEDSDDRVQLKAVLLLGSIGSAAKDAVPKLIALTKNPDAQIRQESAAALNKIDPAWRILGR